MGIEGFYFPFLNYPPWLFGRLMNTQKTSDSSKRRAMKSSTPLHRGRPKGTGLDDRAKLRALAEMLAADPQLKPTTAIKNLGVTDPSAIRRLRDKLKEMQSMLEGAKGSERAPRSRSIALRAKAEPTYSEEPSLKARVSPRRSNELSIASPAPQPPHEPNPPAQSASQAGLENWLTSWFALNLTGVNAALDMQRAYFDYLFKNPGITLALKQHVRANEFLIACTGTKRHTRRR